MPIDPVPNEIQGKPHELTVVTATQDVMVTVQVFNVNSNDMSGVDAVALDLADYLQAWPGRSPEHDVIGAKYQTLHYTISPTPADPEPDPEP